MKIYIAGVENNINEIIPLFKDDLPKIYVLSSFFYLKQPATFFKFLNLSKYFADVILDSGAFTFINSPHKTALNWDEYCEQYAEGVKKTKYKKYFELDIDALVGYDEVKRLRMKLERLVGFPCVPAWHRSRGIDEFKRLCNEYNYIGIGGIAAKEILPSDYKYFPYFINEAHKRNCKIHALGFTGLNALRKYHFDSVDSASWTYARSYGTISKFDGRKMHYIHHPPGKRTKQEASAFSFYEWVKFQQYALTHL